MTSSVHYFLQFHQSVTIDVLFFISRFAYNKPSKDIFQNILFFLEKKHNKLRPSLMYQNQNQNSLPVNGQNENILSTKRNAMFLFAIFGVKKLLISKIVLIQ